MGVRANTADRSGETLALPAHLALPLAAAVKAACPVAAIRSLLRSYEFDGLEYIVAQDDGRATIGQIAWSTYPGAWPALYRLASYATVDPRLARMRKRVTPYLWEGTGAANDEYTRRFLVHSARYGIRSSIVVTLQNGAAGQIVLTFNSSASPVTAERRECFLASLGDLVLIAMGLHEFVLARHLVKAAPCKYPGLTPRERECLKFAACGLTSADIGNKLSLTERTVNFHFSRLRQKLGALNRPEAIARGVSLGYVTLD